MTIATSRGWAVMDEEGIVVKTVSQTRRAAIVNWIVIGGQMVTITDTDEAIEKYWQRHKGDAEAVEVSITHVAA